MIPRPDPVIHLYRGAPFVRPWSKYKQIVEGWALCGIRRDPAIPGPGRASGFVADPRKVSCRACLDLMQPRPEIQQQMPFTAPNVAKSLKR